MNHTTDDRPIAIIAEDEDIGRLLLAEAAAACGLLPIDFANGQDALDEILKRDVAIAFLDVSMPGMDGYTVCRKIRELPRFASLPIVMVTGRDDTDAVTQAFDAGATDFIAKPVNWSLLPHRLAYILRNSAVVRKLADRESKVRALVEAIPHTLWVVSASGELIWSPNDTRRDADGSAATTPGTASFPAMIPAYMRNAVLDLVRQTAADGRSRKLEYRDDAPASGSRSAELTVSRCDGGDVLIVRQDTSERTAAAENIAKLAYYDTLTGLPNRPHCMEIAAQLLANVTEFGASQDGLAFIYLDLNGFKRINDAFGHSAGDNVLKQVAATITTALAPFQTQVAHLSLSRLGGDEFVILVRHAHVRPLAVKIAEACCTALATPVTSGKLEFLATPSVGIAMYPDDGTDVESLLKYADTAMYQAKAAGAAPKIAIYTAAMSARLRDTLELEASLRRAVRADALGVQYQPKFSLHDRSIVGVEALMRWVDPEHGEVSPTRFIPIAEESGLIVDLGMWMIRKVCRQLREWLDRGIEVPVAINLSGMELLFGDPARLIEAETTRLFVPPGLIEVEITESVFVSDATAARDNVDKIRRLGCQIALDDFGTGYSSLAYLTRFPPDRLKIDRSFVRNVDRSTGDAAIANAILSLANSVNVMVTAEGVERGGQLEWLRIRGCREAQGFLLSRPLTSVELERRFLDKPERPEVVARIRAV
jgi:diguanylate cyclase (GGDEF)-like protein